MKTDRFVSTISNNQPDPEGTEDKGKSRKFDVNEGLKTVGSTLAAIFRKPDNITNTYITENKDDDNTMLYVGIGGAALLVVLLIVFMK